MVYVKAPEGTITKVPPVQMAPLLTTMAGGEFTRIFATADPVETQPRELVPVT
jgi:hypothetical protein